MIEEVHSDDGDQPKLSKRKLKKMSRLSVAQLKQLVFRPGKKHNIFSEKLIRKLKQFITDVVEMHDVTAKDPALLILLKSTR
jgi:splicing factor 3B subunit 2